MYSFDESIRIEIDTYHHKAFNARLEVAHPGAHGKITDVTA